MKLFYTLLLLILPFSLAAEDGEWFVGLDGGVTGAKLSNADSNASYAFGPEFGLKFGLRENNSRIYVGFTSANDIGSDISTTQNPYLALEGISDEFKVVAKSTAKFYMGVRIGASFAEVDGTTKTAFLGGVQTGLVFMLPADFEIELAYRHYWAYANKVSDFNAGAVYTGLNYKFGAL